jgi:hypothetical protein
MNYRFLLSTLTVLSLLSCKSKHDDPLVPDPIRREAVARTSRDIQYEEVSFSYQYGYSINERTNEKTATRFDKDQINLDFGFVRQPIEAFINAHPKDYQLYIRLELRQPQSDTVLADGTRSIQAGGVYGTPGGKGNFFGAGGMLVTAIDHPYSWNEVSAELKNALQSMFGYADEPGMKLMVAVYDYRRWLTDLETINGRFDSQTVKLHDEGGARLVYRGWNVEMK